MLHPRHRFSGVFAAAALSLTLAGCSLVGQGSPAPSGGSGAPTRALTVITHDSFALDDAVLEKFTKGAGYDVTFVAPGDAGALVNQLILTKDSPLGDVVYGVDNTFAGRALDEGVFAPYSSPDLPVDAGVEKIEDGDALTPIDRGDVCINADREWFAKNKLEIPKTLNDLTKPRYKDKLVVTNPASSSPGLAFLLATVAEYGPEGWQGYWAKLKDNGVKVVDGWETAYTVDFSGSAGKGTKPLVLSYSSSPAAEVPEGESESSTVALLDTCYRQVEYAGVLTGAKNPEGAQAFIDFLLSDAVQADIPSQMYVYPIDPEVPLPADWAKHAPLSKDPKKVDPAWLTDNRNQLIKDWSALVVG